MIFVCCVFAVLVVALFRKKSLFSVIIYTEGRKWAVEVELGGFFTARKNGKEVWNLCCSKSHQSNGRKSMPLCAGHAVTATRVTACYLMTAKKQNVCSSFDKKVSTSIIFWKQCCRMKRNCTRKSYSKTGLWDNCPHKSYPRIFWIALKAQERNYYENE